MTDKQFLIFDTFRNQLKNYCHTLNERFAEELIPLQKAAAQKDTPFYPIQTPVVYNTALDEITRQTEIKKIVIGDNPGKNEQLLQNQKYLVGQAGKIATSFFNKNPEFNTDFRKNVIILNKTPFHSAKTNHLNFILKNASQTLKEAIQNSIVWMAQETAKLHQEFCKYGEQNSTVELWLVGYAELKNKGIFISYRDSLKQVYLHEKEFWDKVFVFQHFSMNRFSIDLADFMKKNCEADKVQAVQKLGSLHKEEIFASII
ncbi:hypothetical protein [Treponema pectinovorum]|uniref:hypothetical protein n=1 Tax=Treponema pectinovorum TaxID=164 RepID=UPI0011CA293B|nr:hypothetical protein [Treponema pectinovorum]